MNPASLLSTGGGGFSGSSGVTDQSATSSEGATGDKNIGFGANPHAGGRAFEKALESPVVMLALLLVAYFLYKKVR